MINQEFARKLFGSVERAIGKYFKLPDGTRVQIVGVAQDGKYQTLSEDPQAAIFSSILQSPSSGTTLLVRANLDPGQLTVIMRSKLRELDSGLPSLIQTWDNGLGVALFAPRAYGHDFAGRAGFNGRNAVHHWHLRNGCVCGQQAAKKELGVRIALGGTQSKEVLGAALGRALKLLALGSAAGLILGIPASRVLASIVYQATSRDPLVLAGVVLAMALLGLLATWIPAQRALSVDPSALLREE